MSQCASHVADQDSARVLLGVRRLAMLSQFTMTSAPANGDQTSMASFGSGSSRRPATRSAKAAMLPVMSATSEGKPPNKTNCNCKLEVHSGHFAGAATSAGPSAPHPKETMMAEHDQTASANRARQLQSYSQQAEFCGVSIPESSLRVSVHGIVSCG